MTQIESIAALRHHVGKEVAVSDWIEVSQERIDQFAEATEDQQWIHVDPERAARESPFEGTIAHGFLTLSLLSAFSKGALSVGGTRMKIKYGLNRVRFVSPVPANSSIRGRFTLRSIEDVAGGIQATWKVTIERKDGEKPVCLAEWLVRYLDDHK